MGSWNLLLRNPHFPRNLDQMAASEFGLLEASGDRGGYISSSDEHERSLWSVAL